MTRLVTCQNVALFIKLQHRINVYKGQIALLNGKKLNMFQGALWCGGAGAEGGLHKKSISPIFVALFFFFFKSHYTHNKNHPTNTVFNFCLFFFFTHLYFVLSKFRAFVCTLCDRFPVFGPLPPSLPPSPVCVVQLSLR